MARNAGASWWSPTGGRNDIAIVDAQSTYEATHCVRQAEAEVAIVLSAPKDAARAALLASIVTASSSTLVAHRSLDVTGFGAVVVAHAELSRSPDPSTLLDRITDSASRLIDGVWLPTVRRLRSPRPSLRHRLAPAGTRTEGFIYRHSREPQVQPGPLTGITPSPAAVAVFGSSNGPQIPALVNSFPAAQIGLAQPAIDVRARYGSDGIEFAYLDRLSDLGPGTSICKICGLPSAATACAFCHVVSTEGRRTA